MAALDAFGIEYLIVGGIAVGYHAAPRFTKDLDVLVAVDETNYTKLFQCLGEFGAPIEIVSPDDFLQPDFVFHFGVPPWRIDILTSIPGVDFREAYADRVEMPFGSIIASCISKEWLIKAKRASGRPRDLLDLESLDSEE